MSNYWIKRIAAYRKDGSVSEISLINGLNCIIGPSNTGKSLIAKAILFAFGEDINLFDKSEDYYKASVEFTCDEGSVVIERQYEPPKYTNNTKTGKLKKLGSRLPITVTSTIPSIESGNYKRTGHDANSINSVLMKLLGFNNQRMIITNQTFRKQQLTWRSLKHLMVITEELIGRPEPTILFPKSANFTSKTANVSALAVIAQDENYNEIESAESDKEKRARRKARGCGRNPGECRKDF